MPTLQAFHHRKKKTKLTLELDYELGEMLKAYAAHYKQVHGAEVSAAELSIEILRQFIAGDEIFQRGQRTGTRREPSLTSM
jgi:hypothetical protein